MPRASERTAVSAKPGRRRNSRAAYRRSARTELMSLAWTRIQPKGLAAGSLRQNVDVVPEEIVRVVLCLDLPQERQIGSVDHGCGIARVVFQVVDVAGRREIRRQGRKGFACPLDASFRLTRIRPLRRDDHVEARDAHGARRGGYRNTARRAMEVLDDDVAHRRRALLKALDQRAN